MLKREAEPAVLRAGLLAVVLLLAPLTLLFGNGSGRRGEDYDTELWWFVSDIPLAFLTLAALPAIAVVVRGRSWSARLLTLVAVLVVIAFAVHPSARGVAQSFRLIGAVAVASTVLTDRAGTSWRVALAVSAIFQTVVATAQALTGGAVGLGVLGEADDPFYTVGAVQAPSGTLPHPYVLAGFALAASSVLVRRAVARRSPAWAAAAALAFAPISFTYSRAAAGGAVLLLLALAVGAIRDGRRYRFVLTGLVFVAVVGGLLGRDGWESRVTQTTSATSEADLTTDRGQLARRAVEIVKDHPVSGVGPGRYVAALPRGSILKPVHTVALLVAAEAGVLAGVAVLLLIAHIGVTAARRDACAVGVWLSLLPPLFLDHWAYSFPVGLVMLGVWVGDLDGPTASPGAAASDAELVHLA